MTGSKTSKSPKKEKSSAKNNGVKPKPVGRPPVEYEENYQEDLINHMGAGFSFESYAGKIGVSKQTIYNWADPEHVYFQDNFLDAKGIATERCRLWWETLGIQGAQGLGPMMLHKRIKTPDGKITEEFRAGGFNSGTWIFNMKNRFGWKDKTELTGENGAPLDINRIEVVIVDPANTKN